MSAQMVRGFIDFSLAALFEYRKAAGFAMTEADLVFVQAHFAEELRDPTEAELRIIDAFWSEQVRHGTLLTRISKMEVHKSSIPPIQKAFESYLALFNLHHKGRSDKFPTLADLSAIAAHELALRGKLTPAGGGIRVVADAPEKAESWLVIPQTIPIDLPTERVFAYQRVQIEFSTLEKNKETRTNAVCSLSAMPLKAVRAEQPIPDDAVLLFSGTDEQMRKLFLRPEFYKTVRRTGFVGAGGLAVSVMNLASGVDMVLDAVGSQHKNTGISELALGAVQGNTIAIILKKSLKKTISLAAESDVRVVVIGTVTDKNRLRIYQSNNLIVDLPRVFLETNGAARSAPATLKETKTDYFARLEKPIALAIKKGDVRALSERLQAHGAGLGCESTGGAQTDCGNRLSAEKLPFATGKNPIVTVCACGFDPLLNLDSPFLSGIYAVVEAVARAVCAGVPLGLIHLVKQGFFTPAEHSSKVFGNAVSGLLGAFSAEFGLGVGAIGIRESVSFDDMRAQLVAFAVGVEKSGAKIACRFSRKGQKIYCYRLRKDAFGVIDFEQTKEFLNLLHGEALRGLVDFAAVGTGRGAAFTVAEGCIGTEFGFCFKQLNRGLFVAANGDVLFSTEKPTDYVGYELEYIGEVTDTGRVEFLAEEV